MTDSAVAFIMGSLFWFAGGVLLVVALVHAWTLFVPFALFFIVFGFGVTVLGLVWRLRT